MRRYARALAGPHGDADDLVQEALARALERRASFRSDMALRPWLLAILHNVFVDGVRRRRAELTRLEVSEAVATALDAPQEHAVRLAEVRARFDALPEDQRAALHLVAIEGLSYQDAAAAIGAPIGTLMSRLGRARAALRAPETVASSGPARLRLVGGSDDQR